MPYDDAELQVVYHRENTIIGDGAILFLDFV